MPTVPVDSRRPSADMPVPSETDLFMALATMKELGRVPSFRDRLDPSLQGNVEDRRQNEDAEYAQAMGAHRISKGVLKPSQSDPIMREFNAMKAKRESEASIGVAGGSR
jgi:hypothetical protein